MPVMNNFPSVEIGARKAFKKCDLTPKYTLDMTVEELCRTFKYSNIITKTTNDMKTIITVADDNGKTTFRAVEPRKMDKKEIKAELSAWCTTKERKGGVSVQYVG